MTHKHYEIESVTCERLKHVYHYPVERTGQLCANSKVVIQSGLRLGCLDSMTTGDSDQHLCYK